MGFIGEEDAQALRQHLAEHLRGGVGLDLFVKPTSRLWVPGVGACDTCDDTRALLGEIAGLSPLLDLRVHDVAADPSAAERAGIDPAHLPALVLGGKARGQVRFLGMPTGLELGTLLSAILHASSGESGLSAATTEALGALSGDVRVRVFVTPTCPFCPRAARAALQMATLSPSVTVEVIEANEFPELADRYGVRGVPKTVINDTVEFVGALPEAGVLEHVLRAQRPSSEAALGAAG